MKKKTLKKLTLNKAQISKLEGIKGGVEASKSWICIYTILYLCDPRKE